MRQMVRQAYGEAGVKLEGIDGDAVMQLVVDKVVQQVVDKVAEKVMEHVGEELIGELVDHVLQSWTDSNTNKKINE